MAGAGVTETLTGLRARLDTAGLLATKWCVQRLHARPEAGPPPQCLLVAGVQRSGTNMVMDVLERSFETAVYHERDRRAFENYQLRPASVIDALIARSRAPLVVVKCLMESQKLAVLLERFAPARALWVFRNYHDVVNSMLRSFGNQAAQVRRIAADRNSDGWLGECMTDETHARVRELLATEIDNPSAAALQWYFRNLRFFEQGLAPDPRVRLVHYDDLVTNPDREFAGIFALAGIAFTPRVMKHVRASSVGRNAPPRLRGDIDALCAALYARMKSAVADRR